MTNYDGFNDNCVYSPAKDNPVNAPLQGDSKQHTNPGSLRSDNQTTSRGGNTSAPGGDVMQPKPLPKGTRGTGTTAESVGRD